MNPNTLISPNLRARPAILLLLFLSVVSLGNYGDDRSGNGGQQSAGQQRLIESYGKLPLSFEANQGQTDPQVKYVSRGRGYTLFLTSGGEAVLALSKPQPHAKTDKLVQAKLAAEEKPISTLLRMKLVGANAAPRVEALEELPGKANYFIGNDPKNWRTNVPTYAKVEYPAVYPGVDLVYYGNQRQLEHDFID